MKQLCIHRGMQNEFPTLKCMHTLHIKQQTSSTLGWMHAVHVRRYISRRDKVV